MISRATQAWAAVATLSALAFWADPWVGDAAQDVVVSTRTGAKRVFPALAELAESEVSVVLRPAGRAPIELVPRAAGGHDVLADGALLGVADPEGVEGLVSSLRMGATVRDAAGLDDPKLGGGDGVGEIEVRARDERWVLRVGAAAVDGSGHYAELGGTRHVVESELAQPLTTTAESWVLRRLSGLRATEALEVGGRTPGHRLKRGDDGVFRAVPIGDAPAWLLSTAAVEARLEHALGARLQPLLPAAEGGRTVLVVGAPGATSEVTDLGACPGEPERRHVRRGSGLTGCIDGRLQQPWRVDDLVERRLVPFGYHRVLSVQAGGVTLRRDGGGWVLEQEQVGDLEGDLVQTRVSEPEVYRWFLAVQDTEVETRSGAAVRDPNAPVVFRTDAGTELTVDCGTDDDGDWCRRDDGGVLEPRAGRPRLELDPRRFEDRRLVELPAGTVAAVELLPGPGADGVRQSVHLDLGVWQLDAPAHIGPESLLDEVRLESLLAAVGSLRSVGDGTPGTVLRTIRVERAGGGTPVSIQLHADCIVTVAGRVAAIEAATCATLGGDLLYDDPLRAALQQARRVEVEHNGAMIGVRRQGEEWRADEGPGAAEALQVLAEFEAQRTGGLRSEPRGPARQRVRVIPKTGAPVWIERGDGWARVGGTEWAYELRR